MPAPRSKTRPANGPFSRSESDESVASFPVRYQRLRRRRSGHGNGHGGGARARLCGGNAMAGKVDVQPGEPVSQGTLPGLSTACIVVAVFLGAGGGM